MNRVLCLLLLLASLVGGPASAQNASEQAWPAVTQAGPIGPARNYRLYGSIPTTYTIAWFNDRTAATVCTYQVEGSLDGIHYHPMANVLDCTTFDPKTSMFHILSKPVTFLRVNVLSYTAGDSTTAVTFQVARGGTE